MAELETKPRVIRVISGPKEVIEAELNAMAGDWVAQVWFSAWAGDHLEIGAVLVAASELRRAALAAGGSLNNRR